MKIDEFLDLAKDRKSCRRFRPDPIPNEYVNKILEASRWAMSGANGQPWEFIVVKDPNTKAKIGEALKETGEISGWLETSRVPEMRQPFYRNFPAEVPESSMSEQIVTVPVIIVICGDPRTGQASSLSRLLDYRSVVLENVSMATQIMHLAAAACGLRSQLVTITFIAEQMIKPVLGIPPMIRVFNLALIGYPAKEPNRSSRRPLEEIVHQEKYDMTKYRSHQQVQDFIRQLRDSSRPVYPGQAKRGG